MAFEHVSLNDTVSFGVMMHHPVSGFIHTADELPRAYVFEDSTDTPILQTEMVLRTNLPQSGMYRGSFVASNANGFNPYSYYEVCVSGLVGGVQGWEVRKEFVLDDLADIYYADIKYVKDTANAQDEYVVGWYKNAIPLSSGNITNPLMSVVNTNTGANLISNAKLTYINDDLAVLRYDETNNVNILPSGEPFTVVTSGVIDSAGRVWSKSVGIDSL